MSKPCASMDWISYWECSSKASSRELCCRWNDYLSTLIPRNLQLNLQLNLNLKLKQLLPIYFLKLIFDKIQVICMFQTTAAKLSFENFFMFFRIQDFLLFTRKSEITVFFWEEHHQRYIADKFWINKRSFTQYVCKYF